MVEVMGVREEVDDEEEQGKGKRNIVEKGAVGLGRSRGGGDRGGDCGWRGLREGVMNVGCEKGSGEEIDWIG